jgi:altronate dehydratase large subunit
MDKDSFDRGLATRKQVLGADYVERALAGAEHLFAQRAVNETVAKAFTDAVLRLEREAVSRGMDIRGTNPTPDNIRGGLTTIEEKALGAMGKAGTRPLAGVLT